MSLLITRILTEDIDFEIGHFHNLWTSVTLTLTLDRVIWHTVVNHSLSSTYIPNFIESETFCGQKDRRTDIETGWHYQVESSSQSNNGELVDCAAMSSSSIFIILRHHITASTETIRDIGAM